MKKLKSWGPFWSYQLNSLINLAHLPRNLAKWAELNAVAVHKILKKFDKRLASFSGASSSFRQEQYQSHAFLQGPMVIELR